MEKMTEGININLTVKGLEMSLQVLEFIHKRGYSWEYEIAKEHKLHKSSIYRIMKFLKAKSLVVQTTPAYLPFTLRSKRLEHEVRFNPYKETRKSQKPKNTFNKKLLYLTPEGQQFLNKYRSLIYIS
jgi:hypothetical protein